VVGEARESGAFRFKLRGNLVEGLSQRNNGIVCVQIRVTVLQARESVGRRVRSPCAAE
jgi:hypothetical protein